MAFRFVAFATLLAYANAGHLVGAPVAYAAAPGPLTYAAPVAKAVVAARAEDYDPNPQYSYGYDIHDSITGDIKTQSETRNGDVVQGSYSLVEPDGTRRIVDYTADSVNGFNAVVHKEPAAVAVKAVAAKVAAPVAYAAPAPYATYAAHPAPIAKFASPFAYSAGPAAYAAPVAYAAHPGHITYSAAPAVAKVSYASPAISYHL